MPPHPTLSQWERVRKGKDTGFPIRSGMTERGRTATPTAGLLSDEYGFGLLQRRPGWVERHPHHSATAGCTLSRRCRVSDPGVSKTRHPNRACLHEWLTNQNHYRGSRSSGFPGTPFPAIPRHSCLASCLRIHHIDTLTPQKRSFVSTTRYPDSSKRHDFRRDVFVGEDSHLMQFHVVGFTSRYTSFL